jgi:hypothetical protein
MPGYKVEKNDFPVLPSDSYFLDLVWIQKLEGAKGPYYRWHWVLAEVASQMELIKQFGKCPVSSQTPVVPTLGNRFGHFIDVLIGKVAENDEGSTEAIVARKFRVKAFVEHNKKNVDGAERVYCNVEKLIVGTAKEGEGIGYKGVPEYLKEEVNEVLAKAGKPLLEIKEKDKEVAGGKKGEPVKKTDIPW